MRVKKKEGRGTWGALSVKCLNSAQVMISRSVSLSPASGCVLTARSLEPASDSVPPSLSAPPPLVLSLSLSLSLKNIKIFLKEKKGKGNSLKRRGRDLY